MTRKSLTTKGSALAPGLITPPIKIGVLRAHVPLRKREEADGGLSSNPRVKYFTDLKQVEIVDIWDLGEGFSVLVENPYLCPTTAELTPAGERAIEMQGRFRRKFAADPHDDYPVPHVQTTASRALLIDIDGIVVEGVRWREDLEGFAREVVRRVLGERFHNVTFWASLSSSAGIKRKGDAWSIGLHVVFVTDRPLDDDKRKALVLLGAPTVPPGAGKLDTSTLSGKQMYFTARPEFRGEDPAPNRSTMVAGDVDEVALEPGLEAQLRSTQNSYAGTAEAGSRPTQLAAGFAAKMALLGDGAGLEGFHRVIRDAIFAFCAENDGSVDRDRLKSVVRARIDGAPKASGRSGADIDRYKSDAYLDESIRGAIALISRDKYAARAFDLPTGTIEDARVELRKGIDLFEAWVTYDGPPEMIQVSWDRYEPWPPEVVAIETPTGSGKTRAAAERAVELFKLGFRPVISGPTHDQCAEIAERLRAHGISSEVYRGLTAKDPDGGVDEEGDPILMCRDSDYALLLRKAGVELKQICALCPYAGSCGYHGQMAKKDEVDTWVIPHASLGYQRPKHTIRPVDVVIIDEDPIDALLSGFGGKFDFLSSKGLLDPDRWGTGLLRRSRMKLAKMIDAGVVSPTGIHDATFWRRFILRHVQALKKNMPASREGRIKTAEQIVALRYEADVWGAIARGGIGLRVLHEDGENQLRVFQSRPITKDWTHPTLILDATPEWEVYRQFFDLTKTISISCDMPHAYVRQILFSASASKLDADDETGRNNMNKLRRIIESRAAGFRRVLVVAQKRVVEHLQTLGLPRHVETVHFNALRGLDRWGDVDLLIVIGRTEPPPAALEPAAEVIFGDLVETLPAGAYYPRAAKGLNTRAGGDMTEAVDATYHPDPRVEALRRRAVQHELMQAIGRVRGANRTAENPVQIDIINEVPLPIAIDEVVSWEDAQPALAEVIAGRYDLVIENPRAHGAAGLIRDLLPDARASRTTQYRERSLFQTPRGNSPKAFETVRSPDRTGRLIRGGARYAIRVRYRHGLWRPLREGEVPPDRAIQRHLFGRPYVLVPRELVDVMPDVYFEERKRTSLRTPPIML